MKIEQPNILFLLSDQHRPDWLAFNRKLPLRTPHLQELAGRGMRFPRAFCPSPLCAPSRACLASGKSYERCGVRNNNFDYPLEQPTYYQSLRDAGYEVVGVGKFDLHKNTSIPSSEYTWNLDGSRLLQEWGFTGGIDNEGKMDGSKAYLAAGTPKGPYLAFLERRGLAAQYVEEHESLKGTLNAYTTALPDDAYCDNWISENGLRFLNGFSSDRPWHLVVNFAGPHGPFDVTKSMHERWREVSFPLPHDNDHPDRRGLLRVRQNYAAMIENIDRQVGRFLEAVRGRGETHRTIVVYSSDHGEMLGDHGRWGKSIWYSASVGIPLIVSGPGIGIGVSQTLVSLHDLAATFIDYAGSAPLPGMDAHSLRPLFEGRTGLHRDCVHAGLENWRMIFDGRFKLVLETDTAPRLFDLDADPWEDINVASVYPEVLGRLHSLSAQP